MAHEAIAECVTDVLTTFWRLLPLPRTPPILTNTKKAIWRDLLSIQMTQSHWLLCVAKEFWLSKKITPLTPLSNLTRASLLVEWKLTAKAKLNCEIYKSWRNCWMDRHSFCHQSSPVRWIAWTLHWILQELKSKLGKFVVAINTRGHSIWVLNERSVSYGRNLCPLWLDILKSLWYSVGDTL